MSMVTMEKVSMAVVSMAMTSHLIVLAVALFIVVRVEKRRAHAIPTWTRPIGGGGVSHHGYFCLISRLGSFFDLSTFLFVSIVILQRDYLSGAGMGMGRGGIGGVGVPRP